MMDKVQEKYSHSDTRLCHKPLESQICVFEQPYLPSPNP
jgi:hypothetical protein